MLLIRGLGVGAVAAIVAALLVPGAFRDCGLAPGRWRGLAPLLAGLLSAALAIWFWEAHCQLTPEVMPDPAGVWLRPLFHGLLLAILVVATATDLTDYSISSPLLYLGVTLGVMGALTSGDLQVCHLWVDWNVEVPQLHGPGIPEWIRLHRHWHGLAWSLTGAAVGWLLTAVIRETASRLMGISAMGSGDVYLMAVIGAFLGWQPTLVAFLIAPLFALAVGPLARLGGRRGLLPYGPFLAAGAVAVMFSWRWIWMFEASFGRDGDRVTTFAVRRFFGDPVLLSVVFGAMLILSVILFGLLRLLRPPERALPPRDSQPGVTNSNPAHGQNDGSPL